MSFASFWAGGCRQSLELATQAAAALDDPEGTLWRGMAVHVGALNLGLLGDFDATRTAAAELRRIGERAGDRRLGFAPLECLEATTRLMGDVPVAT